MHGWALCVDANASATDHVVTGSKCNKLAVWDVSVADPVVKLIALPEAQSPLNVSLVVLVLPCAHR